MLVDVASIARLDMCLPPNQSFFQLDFLIAIASVRTDNNIQNYSYDHTYHCPSILFDTLEQTRNRLSGGFLVLRQAFK
jgi:hypothetical protein